MNYYYLDSQNTPCGPAALADIRAMAMRGALGPEPVVCPVGGTDWAPVFEGTSDGGSAPPPPPPPPAESQFAKLLRPGRTSAAVVQLAGLVMWMAFFFLPLIVASGLGAIGLILILAGSGLARRAACGACGNAVAATSRLCPACGRTLLKNYPRP